MQLTTSRLHDAYCQCTPTSAKLYEQARQIFPSGVTHDARFLEPHPIYVQRAEGSRKWDVDDNEYVDYFGGHGALLLGHNHPQVTEAVRQQLAKGTHYGACHELELRWASLIQQLMPSAERVRFTSSGTEATLMALRLARAHTGCSKVIRFTTNFHGWQDHVAFGVGSHHDGTATPGVLDEVAENILLCEPNNMDQVRKILTTRDDVAAVILEPTGASWGHIPTPPAFLHDLRELTAAHDVVLIFDEVVTGFRVSPGGAQGEFGITPDLTTLAKVVAGGFPGGVIVGRCEILDWLDHRASAANGREKIGHHGTFNANPVSAAAGIAALEIVANSDACQRANDYAGRLRHALQEVIIDEDIGWCVYGTFSGFHIFTNPDHDPVTAEQIEAGQFDFRKLKAASSAPLTQSIRLALLANGVDVMGWPGGPTSAVHTDDDLQKTAEAMKAAIGLLKDEGAV